MRYKVFWYVAIPLLTAAIVHEWFCGMRTLVGPTLGVSVILAHVIGSIIERRADAEAKQRNDQALLCAHGNRRYGRCQLCSEEFAFQEKCDLCGKTWDMRHETHTHDLLIADEPTSAYRVPAVQQDHFTVGSRWGISASRTMYVSSFAGSIETHQFVSRVVPGGGSSWWPQSSWMPQSSWLPQGGVMKME